MTLNGLKWLVSLLPFIVLVDVDELYHVKQLPFVNSNYKSSLCVYRKGNWAVH